MSVSWVVTRSSVQATMRITQRGSPMKRSHRKLLPFCSVGRRAAANPFLECLEERTLLSTGLVAAYSFDEGSGTILHDTSGSGNNGTISNATWSTSGKFGDALSFNGTSALVNIPNAASLELTTGMTLEAWVDPSTVTSAWRDVVYKGNDNYWLEASSTQGGVPAAGATVGSSDLGTYGTATLPVNTWTFLAETYNGADIGLWVNGVEVSTLAIDGENPDVDGSVDDRRRQHLRAVLQRLGR